MTLRREQKSHRIIIGDQKLVNAVWSRCKQTVSLSRVKLREKYRLNWSLLNQCCFFVGDAWEIIIQTATRQSINDSCQQQKILELKLRKELRKRWSLNNVQNHHPSTTRVSLRQDWPNKSASNILSTFTFHPLLMLDTVNNSMAHLAGDLFEVDKMIILCC